MFFFGSKKKNNEKKSVKEAVSPEPRQSWNEDNPQEYLNKILTLRLRVTAVMINVCRFKSPKTVELMPRVNEDVLIDFVRKTKGRIFELDNKNVLIFYSGNFNDDLQTVLVQLQFLLNSEPIIAKAIDVVSSGAVSIFDNVADLQKLQEELKHLPAAASVQEVEKVQIKEVAKAVLHVQKKTKRDLSPQILDKVQKSLAQVDFSSLIRRQAVCAVIGKSAPQMLFDEVYVSIPDLRDILLPDVDLTSNPWLFMHLTETLDKRVLAHVSRHDDGALTSNFSMNLNVSTILSDEFLEFDEHISPSMRSTIVLELQLVDIFNDVKAFLLAKSFAQYRGYKICIDGITVDKLQYINRENLNCDLMKIFWHPSFLDIINEDKHFKDYVNKAERAKMILCRVDDAKAIEVGNSLGINLYQGRYVQRLLYERRKKKLF